MHTNDFAPGSCLQTEGIVVAQVLLRGERQALDVLDGLNIVGAYVEFLQFVPIERNVVVDIRHDFIEPLTL